MTVLDRFLTRCRGWACRWRRKRLILNLWRLHLVIDVTWRDDEAMAWARCLDRERTPA